MQIGHHHRDQQSRDVRVRFANEHELNDNHPKGIALYHRGFKLNGYTQHSGIHNLGVSPSLVSRYCEGDSFWGITETANRAESGQLQFSGFHHLLPFF